MIRVSAPGKVHLLGEHTVVYGKPALLSAINLRVKVTVGKEDQSYHILRKEINNFLEKKFHKKIPPYKIESEIPVGCGLGFSAAASSAIIAAMLTYFKIKWDLNLVNELTFEAEKSFHGNPSGGDNTTVVNGGLIWFRKEFDFLKSFSFLPFSINPKLQNFILLYSGEPKERTRQMIKIAQPKIQSILDDQESLTKQIVLALKEGDQNLLIKVIKKGERNLEKIGVVGNIGKIIIRDIEKLGGAAKISGAGGVKTSSGMLLSYHKNPQKILNYAKENNLQTFIIKLGEEGLRKEG